MSERETFVFQNPLHQRLALLIEKQLSIDEIVESVLSDLLPESASQQDFILAGAKIYHALMIWEQEGYIVEAPDETSHGLPSQVSALGETWPIQREETQQKLIDTRVAIQTLGSIPATELIASLKSLQINVLNQTDIAADIIADIEVVLTDDYLREELNNYHQKSLHFQRPWLLVKPVGSILWIGPLFLPDKTGCWHCLAYRLRANRPVAAYLEKRGVAHSSIQPNCTTTSTLQTAVGLTATEVLKWILQQENHQIAGQIVTLDTLSLKTEHHHLVKRPQCPQCGDPCLSQPPLPLILGNRKKEFTSDGGHRSVSPEATLKKYQHHISPITGVIQELRPISAPLNGLAYAYLARYPFAATFDDMENLLRTLGGRGAGKGKTPQQAKASGLCEAIERYSGVFQGDEPRITSSYQMLGEKAIHPNICMNYSQTQYQTRHAWNTNCRSFFQKVPDPFDETREIEWTALWSLTQQTLKYLPTAYCYFGYPQPVKPDCWADSNGCAAGNNLEEAILQGMMELIERDSVALWWYHRLSKPRVDLDSFDDPYFQAIQNSYRSLHRDLWVLDITSDLNIPTFAAISRRSDRAVEDIILGYGAHFDSKIAISRALTEVSQILPAVLQSTPDGNTQYPSLVDPLALSWWKTATLENQPYLTPRTGVSPKIATDYPQTWSDNLLEDILTCQRIIESKGMELLVLDQTRPDIELRVVRVVIPGMRHFWKRLGPGRLYEVPLQMGWISEPVQESQLNPFPMWM